MFESMFEKVESFKGYGSLPYVSFKYNPNDKKVSLKIPVKIFLDARLIAGQKYDILIDKENRRARLVMLPDGAIHGWKMNKGDKSSCPFFKYTAFNGCLFPDSETIIIKDVDIIDKGLEFDIPENLQIMEGKA